MNKRINRVASAVICAVFFIVMLSAPVFISTHANHNCTGEGCAVCASLRQCEEALNTGSAAAASQTAAPAAVFFTAPIQTGCTTDCICSPVQLKVRLLN
ncbi:MAG: hypothetical protein MJ079_00035 [Ruminococcus sp.]|nr:hypothetical protein [Ruminococcus sp.]